MQKGDVTQTVSASANVSSQIDGLGSNLLIVTPGQATQGSVKMGAGSLDTLTMSDANTLGKLSSVAGVAPGLTSQGTAVYNQTSYATTVEGTSEDFPQVRDAQVASGRFFNNLDVQTVGNVAVLGSTVVQNLLGDPSANVVGQTIDINQTPFTIIGTLQTQGSSGATNNDDRILIPISTAMNRVFDKSNVRTIYVSAKSPDLMNQAQFDIEQALRDNGDPFPVADPLLLLLLPAGRRHLWRLSGAQGIAFEPDRCVAV